LKIGNVAPADAKLLADQHLSVDESALTGESLPVDKEGGQPVYSGTTVKRGDAEAVVTATGRRTKFARTVELVEEADETSHFQKAVLRIGYFLIALTLFLDLIIFLVSVFLRGDPWLQVALLVMALTLAGIPSALPAVLSVTMSIGAHRLAQMKAIVSRLAAMEEMAGLEVLCADKTGTLTLNQLTLQDPVPIQAEDEHDLILAAALTCPREESGDPIDEAVLGAFRQRFDESELDDYRISDFQPFDPTSKRAEAEAEHDAEKFRVAKGAPQAIVELVGPSTDERRKIVDRVDELGQQGFRCLGVAREEGGRWKYLGLLPLLDPPREDSADVIRDAQNHGIDVRMVTGDHAAIGRQVAAQVGLAPKGQEPRVVEATDLFGEAEEAAEGARKAGQTQIRRQVLSAKGFAQVTPDHKFRLIKVFQEHDRIVGMTGDGVNDAPALQQADVGIAVAGATDAARSASDLVLTDPGLKVITRAVEEARRIFERMTSYATYRITETMRVLMFIAIAILLLGYYPVTPIMIVLLAILNDIPIMAIAWDNAPTARHPVRWDMPRVLTIASVLSVTGLISSFLLFWYFSFHQALPRGEVQTLMFLKLLVAGHMTLFVTRSRGWLWQKPWPNLWMFLALEGTQVAGTLVAVYGFLVTPIGWLNAGIVWAYAIVWILVLDAVKILSYYVMDQLRRGTPPQQAD
jgi:H+-transporting ATPase